MPNQLPPLPSCTVAVVGLGYVGLPLAVAFGTPTACPRTGTPLARRVIGFDINAQRLAELGAGHDRTHETSAAELAAATRLEFTAELAQLDQADVFVVTVPTPIDSAKRPDLSPLEKASASVGQALQARAAAGATTTPVVIYESTVYPGATEEVCVPILERTSGLRFNEGFVCGYSPERINPGDHEHRLATITKVTSGSTPEAAAWVDALYGSIIAAATHLASSIKVAEAAKVIEDTQRDLNIALVNELAMIFRRIGIDTLEVIEAAASKWNFLPFKPGLVGGHCIGVDPYYLTHKAEQLGYHPQVVLAGRRINDGMGEWIASQLVLELARRGVVIGGSEVLVLGLTFKENCPDLRNSKVFDLIAQLQSYGMRPVLVDPWADPAEVRRDHPQLPPVLTGLGELPQGQRYGAVVAAVAHQQFAELEAAQWQQLLAPGAVLMDLKGIAPRHLEPIRL